MLVFIMRVDWANQFYIVDEQGSPVCAILFGSSTDAEDYCAARGYIIGTVEED